MKALRRTRQRKRIRHARARDRRIGLVAEGGRDRRAVIPSPGCAADVARVCTHLDHPT